MNEQAKNKEESTMSAIRNLKVRITTKGMPELEAQLKAVSETTSNLMTAVKCFNDECAKLDDFGLTIKLGREISKSAESA